MDNNSTKDQKMNKTSFLSFLYNQIISIEIKPKIIKLDNNQTYKRSEHDPLIEFIEYLSELFTNYCLPYRLSPIIISIPGLLFNMILLLLIYLSSKLDRYHYILWLISRYLTYILDMIDGKQARRNQSQSLARHYWDHWCDTMNIVLSSLILIEIYPENFKYRFPSIVLMSMVPIGFYLNFFRYYCTGKLVEPYTLHLWHYVYVLSLALPVILYGSTLLNNHDYQVILATLSTIYLICFLMKLIEYFISIMKTSLFSIKLFLMIVLSPTIWFAVYFLVLKYQPLMNNSLTIKTLFRCFALMILCNHSINVHYKQLIDQSTSFLTIDSIIFIFSLLTLFSDNYYTNLILIITLFSLIIFINIIRLIRRLKVFIDKYPDPGFPIFIVEKKNIRNINNNITNGNDEHLS